MPIALEAVKNGKHVMITKPLSNSEEAGVVNMMSLSTCFAEKARYLGKLAQDDE